MLLETATDILSSMALTFVVGFVILFIVYYFTSPMYTEYGDEKSRLYYSMFTAFYFSLVLSILFGVLPPLSSGSGMLAALAAGLVIIMISTLLQVYAVSELTRRGIIKMRQKRASPKRQKK